jgi:LysW-gamma-L-lysine carboxypeptidase
VTVNLPGGPDDQAATSFLQGLLERYSPSTQEHDVAAYAVDRMRQWGFEAELDAAGNAVGRLGRGPLRILLLGHIDTVPGVIPVRREGELLYGRGAVDAKGPLAAFVVAAARVGALPSVELCVVGAVEEEAATSKGAYHVAATHKAADYVIIGEPSAWDRITLGYKGRLLVDYALQQPCAHTAGEAKGAAELAVDFWLQVAEYARAFNADKERLFDTLDPSLRSIGTHDDGLVDAVELTIGLRLPLGLDVDDLRNRLPAWAGEATVTLRGHELPYRAPKRNLLVSAFTAAIRAEGSRAIGAQGSRAIGAQGSRAIGAQGSRAALVFKTGTSDMNVLGPRWDCPIVAYGPGDSALDHTPNEHIRLDEYLGAIRVLESVLTRLAGSSESG